MTDKGDWPAVIEELLRLNNEIAVLEGDRARQTLVLEGEFGRLAEANRSLEESLERLKLASAALERIGAVLPICMECGKVKNPAAEWQEIAQFLQEGVVPLSHGYCPDCASAVETRLGLRDSHPADPADAGDA
ncbi:MAG: hypothetical protein R6V57_20635 [Vicinamibacterales bacterium]